jgi:hypothetical protein
VVVERRFIGGSCPNIGLLSRPRMSSTVRKWPLLFWRVSEFGTTTGALASPADATGAGLNRAQSQVMVNPRRLPSSEIHRMKQELSVFCFNFVVALGDITAREEPRKRKKTSCSAQPDTPIGVRPGLGSRHNSASDPHSWDSDAGIGQKILSSYSRARNFLLVACCHEEPSRHAMRRSASNLKPQTSW